jgi:hypothetical protein
MLQFTVLIKFTGLLLLTPNTNAGALPLHVLMPIPGSQVPMPHFPEVGVKIPKDQCSVGGDIWWDEAGEVCYVNMDGWFMEIGPPSGGSPSPVKLPFETTNLSTALHRYLDAALLGETPDRTRLRSRVTIYSGAPGPSPSCELYEFKIKNPIGSGTTTSPLTNVLDWRIDNVQQPELVLVRRPLNPGAGHDRPETVFVVPPTSGVVEVYVRQVPDDERQHKTPTETQQPPFKNTHFHAYYDLLEIPWDERVLPDLTGRTATPSCPWPGNPFAPGAPTCLVASALLPP